MVKAFKIAVWSVALVVVLFCLTLMIPPFSEAKIGQLKRGMTTNEVTKLLGDPSNKLEARWYYNPRRPSFETLILWFDGVDRLEGWTID